MTQVIFIGNLPELDLKNKINQGDFVFCKATGGANDFWGIYGHEFGVASLNGGGNSYLGTNEVFLGETYRNWTITKRIRNDKIKLTLEELI